MSIIKINRTVDDLQSLLNQTLKEMEQFTHSENYSEAQNCMLKSQQLKKDLSIRKVYQMEVRHQEQREDLSRNHNNQYHQFTSFWKKKMDDYYSDADKLTKQMQSRHSNEASNLRKDLQNQLPFKVKESSECLNLRKMEQHMVKQKNFAQAHKIQTHIFQIQKSEREKWMKNRNQKIEKAVNTLLGKQQIQLNSLKKKIKTAQNEQNQDRGREEERINLKYANIDRQLKMKQQKEILALKGHFTSKGGEGSPLLTKSMLFNNSRE